MYTDKELIKDTFDKSASRFDEIGPPMFRFYGKLLANYSDIQPHHQILDIACGKGASTFPAAEKLSSSGKITGIDIAPQMIEECSKLIPHHLKKQINLLVMDAENLEFINSSFDRVISSFGLFFLPNIEKGLSEIYRVLKPGGLLVFSSWNNEYQLHWLHDILLKYLPELNTIKAITSKDNIITDADFRTKDGIEKILKTGRFKKVDIITSNLDCYYNHGEEWIETRWHTAYRMFFEKMGPAVYNAAKKDLLEQLEAYKVNGKIKITMSAFLTKAEKE